MEEERGTSEVTSFGCCLTYATHKKKSKTQSISYKLPLFVTGSRVTCPASFITEWALSESRLVQKKSSNDVSFTLYINSLSNWTYLHSKETENILSLNPKCLKTMTQNPRYSTSSHTYSL